jgi:meso-butanediol dehydrogenase/(S,S)-butanediol dehydrogenase/diacetyl reductase
MSTDHAPTGAMADRIAVVTGGARGIGRAIVDRFATGGATVVIGDLTDPGDVGAGLGVAGHREWVPLDVTDETSVLEFAQSVEAGHGGVDVLVNNAGVMAERSITDESVAEWDLTMAVNLRGPFLMAKHLVPLMEGRVDPSIINMGSIEGIAANPLHAAYAASKGGIHALTRSLAIDLGPLGIRCNAIAPGWIDTELNRAYVERHPDRDQVVAELSSLHPVGRIGSAGDVAAAACWLASADAGFVTGQVVQVEGGRTIRLSLPPSLEP